MRYILEISRRARKSIAKLPEAVKIQISRAIRDLSENPRPPGCLKLEGMDDQWRIRVGRDCRVVYEIHQDRLIVLIVDAGPRGNIYKRR